MSVSIPPCTCRKWAPDPDCPRHGRHTIGIELNPSYAELAARRTRQLSLLA